MTVPVDVCMSGSVKVELCESLCVSHTVDGCESV